VTAQYPDGGDSATIQLCRRRLRHRCLLTAATFALAALVLVAAGCGSATLHRGVARAGAGTQASSEDPASAGNGGAQAGFSRTRVLAFVSCMRKKGVPNFPAPNGQGGFLFNSSGLNPNSPSFQHAMHACRRLAPGGTPADVAQAPAKAARFGECMRSHGLPNFPDPRTSGGNFTQQIPSNITPNSPAFQKAIQACQSVSPLPGGGA
jgi:hypothetical protein